VVSDAIVRNNVIINCLVTGITAAPHAAVPTRRNVTIVNNTIVGHPMGVRLRWSKAENMTFCNNAVYCPDRTAIDAAGIEQHILSSNYVNGALRGAQVDGTHFCAGGAIEEAFVGPYEFDFRPRSPSILLGTADPGFAPAQDFVGRKRTPPFDVGAYEVGDPTSERARPLKPGFKASHVKGGQ
jgi:hypothetical protein